MQKAMYSTFRNLAAGLTLVCALQAHAAPLPVDRIVAVVNNGVITEYELKSRLAATLRQLEQQQTPLPPRGLLEKQVLERMITERTLIQMAEDTNIRVDGTQLDRALARLAQQNNMTPDQFRAALAKEGTDYNSVRERIRNEMTIARLRERDVDSRVTVTEAEIDNYLANPGPETGQQTEYRLAHILVLTPEAASPEQLEQARAKIDKAHAELAAGTDFRQVSAAYSDAQNALAGGELGWRAEAQLPTLFALAAKDLKPGGISPVLKSANGFHIVKLLDLRGKDVTLILTQTHARHILVKLNEVVNDADARNRLLQLRERIENGGNFGDLAKLHSDDLSAGKGGDLGWINPGDTVPQFERAMDALKPGELSEPIASPFGWHLIQVLERREQDVTQERRRLEARQAIRNRKAEETFEEWVRQARDRAYVEYRLDD